MLSQLSELGATNQIIRIHYKALNRCPPENLVIQNAGVWLASRIPENFTVQLHAWEELPQGDLFHDRFALTERGGIQLGVGFATQGPQANVLATILNKSHAEGIRAKFDSASEVYLKIGRTICVESDGTTSVI